MKITVIPAQITTVEDRIAGNLGLNQLLLLVLPIFGDSILYVILPPNLHGAAYKIVVMLGLFVICGILAIRFKGKLLVFWLIVLVRYNLRPRYYVFNKHSLHGREVSMSPVEEPAITAEPKAHSTHTSLSLSLAEIVKLKGLIENPMANVAFETKKGGLYVRITEVKQES
ncbi:MAG TPA: hypothetical protein VMR95_03065 [Candidatus Binatia bacterium]|jgi:hypothetical protein|nr:hypothetical protein [Candidatus Binatia bacterium]